MYRLPEAAYDAIAEEYAARATTATPGSLVGLAARTLLLLAGDVAGRDVCDLGCGEGHLARALAGRGVRVVGVDLSARLLEIARARTADAGVAVTYVCDDAQALTALPAGAFDAVLCSLALMDIADLAAVYAAVARVLRPGGRFAFAVLHPCFQGPGTDVQTDAGGRFVARLVPRYAREGYWRSVAPHTLRGRLGAHHRTLTTYLNRLLAAGFGLRGLTEPTLPPGAYTDPYAEGAVEVPPILVVDAVREAPTPTDGH